MSYEGKDRRRCKRNEFHEPVQYQLLGSHAMDIGMAANLSDTGLRLVIKNFSPIESKLLIQFYPAPGIIQNHLAKIVWINQLPYREAYEVGLAFDFDAQQPHIFNI